MLYALLVPDSLDFVNHSLSFVKSSGSTSLICVSDDLTALETFLSNHQAQRTFTADQISDRASIVGLRDIVDFRILPKMPVWVYQFLCAQRLGWTPVVVCFFDLPEAEQWQPQALTYWSKEIVDEYNEGIEFANEVICKTQAVAFPGREPDQFPLLPEY